MGTQKKSSLEHACNKGENREATGYADFKVKVQVQSPQCGYCLPFKQMSLYKAPAATKFPLCIGA